MKTRLILILIFTFFLNEGYTQACCSAGTPLSAQMGLEFLNKGDLLFNVAYDYNYLNDVYEHYNQLGPRAIYGHGVHFQEDDFRVFSETGTALAHCPTSNLFLGSGLFSIETAMMGEYPVRTGLATDLGGGTNFSQLVSMNEAYKIAQLAKYALTAHRAFYLATRGAANALYLDDKIGTIAKGYEADIAILDLKATPIIDYRLNYTTSLEETLFVLMMMGDDRAVRATYVAGNRVYFNDIESGSEYFSDF